MTTTALTPMNFNVQVQDGNDGDGDNASKEYDEPENDNDDIDSYVYDNVSLIVDWDINTVLDDVIKCYRLTVQEFQLTMEDGRNTRRRKQV